jgi:modification methylase
MNLNDNKTTGVEAYNKSSEKMEEISDKSIDLVIADPPWNVGVKYGSNVDNAPHKNYSEMMKRVISEINRVLKLEGITIIILPKIVRKGNKLYDYPKLFTDFFCETGFFNIYDFQFLVRENDFTCLPAKEINEIGKDCHSEEICGLIFSKNKKLKFNFPNNKKYEYASKEGHPCPYPIELVKDLLDTFYNNGNNVLDPFMGTGSLGAEVINRKGHFFGYELNKEYYQTAKLKMSQKLK